MRSLAALALAFLAGPAAARTTDGGPPPPSEDSVAAGAFLPATGAARFDAAQATARSWVGYDAARAGALFGAEAQISLFRRVSLSGAAIQPAGRDQVAPSVRVDVALV